MEPRTPPGPPPTPTPPTGPTSAPTTAPAGPRLGRRWWASALALVCVAAFFAPAYVRHARLSATGGWAYAPDAAKAAGNPAGWVNVDATAWVNDDARQQVWPLLRLYDEGLFANDYPADYYLACFPIGYRGLYTLTSAFDPRAVSKVLSYGLVLLTAILVGRAARRLRGPAAAWAAFALCLGASIFMSRIAGGLPRSFAFPVLALAALSLATGRPVLLGLSAVLAAMFYPAAGVVIGLAMAVWLLTPPAVWRGGGAEGWGLGRRVAVVAVTALLATGAALPTLLATREYGAVLRPSDAAEYPELGPQGRYAEEDRGGDAFSLASLKNFVDAPLAGLGGEWDPGRDGLRFSIRHVALMAMLAVGLAGFVLLARGSGAARRVALLPAAAVVGYLAAALVTPFLYLPARYQLYPLAVAAVVVVPAGLAHLATLAFKVADQRRAQALALALTVGVYLLFFSAYRVGSKDGGPPVSLSELSRAGLSPVRDNPADAADYQALLDELRDPLFDPPPLKPGEDAGGQPRSGPSDPAHEARRRDYKRALFAGFPPDMDGLPYLTGRRVLVTRENHQAFHRLYAEQMRRRTKATLDALFDPTTESLRRLRDEFDVTHLVVDTRLYGPNPPAYFAPFDQDLAALRAKLGPAQPAVLSPRVRDILQAQVYPATDGKGLPASTASLPRWIVLDLKQVR